MNDEIRKGLQVCVIIIIIMIIIIINSLFTVGEKVVYTQVIMHKLINTNYLQTKRKITI